MNSKFNPTLSYYKEKLADKDIQEEQILRLICMDNTKNEDLTNEDLLKIVIKNIYELQQQVEDLTQEVIKLKIQNGK